MKLKLIVGLANPGNKYSLTRHNIGAWYIDYINKFYKREKMEIKKNFYGYTGKFFIKDQKIHLLIPITFMNFSGKSVLSISSFYKIPPEEILIVHDELHLPPGCVQIKFGGTHKGHNGVKNIIKCFGNNPNFYRLCIGIGKPQDKKDIISFVLSPPNVCEKKLIIRAIHNTIHYMHDVAFYLGRKEKYILERLISEFNHANLN